MLIFSKGIASWSWLMSLLGAGTMGVYIDYPILRDHSVGHQDMDITCYDSMVDLIKDVSNGLWDVGLCVLQYSCEFLVDTTNSLFTESSDIYILGVS